MGRRLILTLFTAFVAGVSFAQPKSFVIWLVTPAESSSASVEVWPAPGDRQSFVWRLVSAGGTILAEMKQPVVPPGYSVNYGDCKVNGVLRHDVIAFVRHAESREWSSDIHSFWFVDAKAKAFTKSRPKQVTCRNEGYGV
ncbi:hypothetical protein [Sulfurivermis fontis]|uniref:hypothetical protein n=1 Tax=Sulfurivermis fontis TaxID=1972068 RepID=UPI000FDC7BE7|nr:hypothetical protein [Sulfurivermis fontis]